MSSKEVFYSIMDTKKKFRLSENIREGIKRINFIPYDIFPYFSIEEGNKLIAEKIKDAKEIVRMIFGEVTSRSLIGQTIINAFNEALEKKPIKIEIIGGPTSDSENLPLGKLIKQKKIQYYKLDIKPMRNFCIVDDTYIRAEHPHNWISAKREGYVLESCALASNLNIIFDRVKEKATPSETI